MGSASQSLFYFFYSSISVFDYFLNLLIYRLRQIICVKHETKSDIVVIIITDKLARCA
ncbi:unknow [Vibrio parahaemolyticus]|nr:unknow [Vibrio parahaemolyticus]